MHELARAFGYVLNPDIEPANRMSLALHLDSR